MSRAPARGGRFAHRLIQWQRAHGRHDLPWQNTRDPYRVWLSEVMLQQTQVSTVLGYYGRFLERFPDVGSLAAASEDEVLALWSGLGYYSRARNLHRCAKTVVEEHHGRFPDSSEALVKLPGIGESTAAAIAAFCFGERVSILDGNVRRVITRWLAFEDDLSKPAAMRALWAEAQALLPGSPKAEDMMAYTQGLMDLGATVCTRNKPLCGKCPLSSDCLGLAGGDPARFPVRTRKLKRQQVRWYLLVRLATFDDARDVRVWLEKRPAKGIWASLQSVPVFEDLEALEAHVQALGEPGDEREVWPPFTHVLTHRDLYLMPHVLRLRSLPTLEGAGQWVALSALETVGLPAPIRGILQRLPEAPGQGQDLAT
ncbi:A/G-specific adenine glycosylase [Hydrogenophaga sp. 5NK40-0174]|uniref:A/G-specific adenine glycosylase n=1 Tax=Hydrogenophaga sp. 5NK40-0174 TaxID=3127649 RepID=UPI003102C6FA